MTRLFQLSYSPWSEKARWALDHHRVPYEKIDHVPMLGEPRLRLAAGGLGRRASVPLFVDGELVLGDSLEIARHAERVGRETPLFPAGRDADVVRWNAASEALAAAGRVLVIARTRTDRDAQREALPWGMPGFLAPTAAMGAAFLARKYGVSGDEASAIARMRGVLAEIRAGLDGRAYLLGDFSYADVAVASCLQVVRPVADEYLRLGPGTRRAWTCDELARDFGDLLAWRDTIYARHRRLGEHARIGAVRPFERMSTLRAAWAPLFLLSACARPSAEPTPVAAAPSASAPATTARAFRPIPEPEGEMPRGFGTVSGRVPGTSEVVSGPRLAAHRVRAVIRGSWARTEVEEDVANDAERVLEGKFVFPLPPGASVSRVALWVGDKLVEGELEEKKRAESIFRGIVDDTVRPRDPALLEHAGGGRFSLTIFPLPPKGTRRVILAYDEPLTETPDGVRYVLPLGLGGARTNRVDELAVDVSVADASSAIVTLGHAADATRDGDVQHVRFTEKASAPSGDFSVLVKHAAEPVAAYVAKPGEFDVKGAKAPAGEPNGYVAIRVWVPPSAEAPGEPPPRSVAIVLDASHGQTAESLRVSGAIALRVVERLRPIDRFVVLACDSACASFPAEGLGGAGDETAIAGAAELVRTLVPGGSSDLASALVAAARRAGVKGEVAYLGEGTATSGELDADAIRDRIRALAPRDVSFRLVGAGPAIDGDTLMGLAASLGGTFEAALGDASLEARADRIAAELAAPIVTQIAVELPPGLAPLGTRQAAVRVGDEVRIFATFAGDRFDGEAVVRGELDGKPYRAAVPLHLDRATLVQNPLVPRAWAEARIARLESSEGDGADKEIVALSRRFHVLSRHTAMLVLENEKMFADLGVARTARLARERSDQAFTDDVAPNAGGPPPLGASEGLGHGGGRLMGEHRTSPPRLRMGSTTVNGRLPPEVIQRIVRQNFGRFRLCYENGLRNNPDLHGRVTTKFVIGRDGSVSTTQNGGSDLPDQGVVACVVRSFSNLSFPQPEGGIVTVSYPITFEPGEPAAPRYEGSIYATNLPGADEWLSEGEPELAKLRSAVELTAASRKAHVSLVRGLLLHGRFADALARARAFADRDADDPRAHELLAWAAAANGDGQTAARALDVVSSLAPRDAAAHFAAARSFEAIGDERRACAHWRARFATHKTDDAREQAVRCTARTGDLAIAREWAATWLSESAGAPQPNARAKALVDALAGEAAARWDESKLGVAATEARLSCTAAATCPTIAVITPTGRVVSSFTPGTTRATSTSVTITGGVPGRYRTIALGTTVDGELAVRSFDAARTFSLRAGGPRTLAITDVAGSWPNRGWGR